MVLILLASVFYQACSNLMAEYELAVTRCEQRDVTQGTDNSDRFGY